MLGLLVFPKFRPHLERRPLIAAAMILIARPVAVCSQLFPSNIPQRDFLMWGGIKALFNRSGNLSGL